MADDQNPMGDTPMGDEAFAPPQGGPVDPTIAQPTTPGFAAGGAGYTTGPGMPPPPDPSMGAAGAAAGASMAAGAAGAGGGDDGSAPPPWLLPAAGGAAAALVIALIAFLLLRGDGDDDSIASETSLTETTAAPETTVVPETTVAPETTLPGPDFVPAQPGFVRVGDREYPIQRTCLTTPTESQTADYQVETYVFLDESDEKVVDRWFDEGGVTGSYFAGSAYEDTDLGEGFGFEAIEGDAVFNVTVNPIDSAGDCLGTVREAAPTGERRFSVVSVCITDSDVRLLLSENADINIENLLDGLALVQFGNGVVEPFFFGTDEEATRITDGTDFTYNATFDDGRALEITYLDDEYPDC